MNLRDEQKKVQQAMNASLSGLQEDPWLTRRILAETKGEEPMKKKGIGALALTVILILALIGTACAVFSSRIAEFFGRNWGQSLGQSLQTGKIAQVGESVTVGDVVFTLDEIAYKNRGLYGLGTVRPVEEKDVLLPYDLMDDAEYFAASREAQELVEKAKASGGRLLTADIWPREAGVDEGKMLSFGSVGYYDQANGDGTVTFSFEAEDGFVINEGTSYQIRLESAAWQADENGRPVEGTRQEKEWIVSCVPVADVKTGEAEQPAAEVSAEGLEGWETVVPDAYRETGTLPVYRAEETDLTEADPAWFNTTGILSNEDGEYIRFNDYAALSLSPEALYYREYRDEEGTEADSGAILEVIQARKYYDLQGTSGPEETELSAVTPEEAKRKAEELLSRLGVDGNLYVCTEAIGVSLERIRILGSLYEAAVADGSVFTGEEHQAYDYSAIPETEEGFYLEYRPLDTDTEDCTGRYGAQFYINGRGIVYASVSNEFSRGTAVRTPEKLISDGEAVQRLAEEISLSRSDSEKGIASVRKAVLSYEAVRAENKADGMEFVPAWTILFTEPGSEEKGLDDFYAVFNAVDGSLIDATFR